MIITPKLVIQVIDTAQSLIKSKDRKILKKDKQIKSLKRKIRKLRLKDVNPVCKRYKTMVTNSPV